jgi:hypothetical protein
MKRRQKDTGSQAIRRHAAFPAFRFSLSRPPRTMRLSQIGGHR